MTSVEAWLGRVRHVILDMDGTVYTGDRVFSETLPFLALLARRGVGHTFLTNNTSKSTAEYLVKLREMGIDATREHLCTPVDATVTWLAVRSVRRVYLLGTPGLRHELEGQGIGTVDDSANATPDAVVVAFDMTLTYDRLCRAAWWIGRGLPFVATHPDFVCPTDGPTVLVDCGSICAALTAATGRAPDAVLGKPDPGMVHAIAARHGLNPGEIAVVGDRLYTDIVMANRAGALAVLVLTGEASEADVAALATGSEELPALVCEGLAALGRALPST